MRIEEPSPLENTVRKEGLTKGAAQFMRGEGICHVNGSFYFTCTQGGTYTFARNARDNSELAGACFAPNGRTMFVNIYDPGLTLAVWGNWAKV